MCGNVWPTKATVHPRVCGEQAVATRDMGCASGSSPRVRGTVAHSRPRRPLHRFIPACAGNRPVRSLPLPGLSVHPRVCGEQCGGTGDCRRRTGSSPRVRGTDSPALLDWSVDRFIPACAGNSRAARSGSGRQPVHPRVCGEQTDLRSGRSLITGSSPRVRGTDSPALLDWSVDRFIPACAGNRFQPLIRRSILPVHPRVCGEQVRWYRYLAGDHGSSPRVRGTGL